MKVGDELVSVNDISFKIIELEQAIEILSTEANLRLVVQTSGFVPDDSSHSSSSNDDISSSNGSNKASNELNGQNSHVDVANKWTNPFGLSTKVPSEAKSTLKRHIRRITIRPGSNQTKLGFQIRGGIDYALGLFVSNVEKDSAAESAGLKVADQIIEVNGQLFSRISHNEAVSILKENLANYISNKAPIKMVVRYLGKLPDLELENSSSLKYDTPIFLDENDLVRIDADTLKSIETLFVTSPVLFKKFKHFLSYYVEKRISFKYFLFLLMSQLDGEVIESIVKHNLLNAFINSNDMLLYKKFSQLNKKSYRNPLKVIHNLNMKDLPEMNSLIVRSTEDLSVVERDYNEFVKSNNNNKTKLITSSNVFGNQVI
jgi:hypothetical protein